MPKKIAILQSNYIPWKGYFDILNRVDEFVILDEVQYTKGDWRNRNLIKTPQGTQWLTVPVSIKGRSEQKINETQISEPNWVKKHWSAIKQNYSKAPYFKDYADQFESIYMKMHEDMLSEINYTFIKVICEILAISTPITFSTDLIAEEDKNLRIVSICQQLKADIYLSGPAAKNYLKDEVFNSHSIQLEWMDYSGYIEYNQLFPPFEHRVSIIDLIFNTGPNAKNFIKGFHS